MATTIGNLITLDGQFTDWPAADSLMKPANTVAGYQVYGGLINDATLGNTYVIGIDATDTADPAIGAGTIIYLNTDQNVATGLSVVRRRGRRVRGPVLADSSNVLQAHLVLGHTRRRRRLSSTAGTPLNFGVSTTVKASKWQFPRRC